MPLTNVSFSTANHHPHACLFLSMSHASLLSVLLPSMVLLLFASTAFYQLCAPSRHRLAINAARTKATAQLCCLHAPSIVRLASARLHRPCACAYTPSTHSRAHIHNTHTQTHTTRAGARAQTHAHSEACREI